MPHNLYMSVRVTLFSFITYYVDINNNVMKKKLPKRVVWGQCSLFHGPGSEPYHDSHLNSSIILCSNQFTMFKFINNICNVHLSKYDTSIIV